MTEMRAPVQKMPDNTNLNPGIHAKRKGKGMSQAQAQQDEAKVPPTSALRLKDLRLKAGYRTVEEALEDINRGIRKKFGPDTKKVIAKATIYQHENGKRPLSKEAAPVYAEHYGVQPGYLLYGDVSRFRVPVRGIVGADGVVLKISSSAAETVIAPPSEGSSQLAAYRIADRGLFPTYHEGDYAYYDEAVFDDPPRAAALMGKECIVQASSGSMGLYIIVSIQQNGTAVLQVPGGRVRTNITVKRAAPIIWIKRATGSLIF